jgi:hypothetical protein
LRQHAEKALIGYKDEIDTLREALRIAAMDVAAVSTNNDTSIGKEDEQQNTDDSYYDGTETLMDNGLDGQVIVDTDGNFDVF